MNALEAMRMAFQGVLANRLRSLLTMLGITIGVASVIILVAVGHGSAVAVQQQIEGLGTNILTRLPERLGGFGGGGAAASAPQSSVVELTMKDVAALQNKATAPDIKSVTPVVNATLGDGDLRRRELQPGQFVGHDAVLRRGAQEPGRAPAAFITDADEQNHARVVVIGPTVVAEPLRRRRTRSARRSSSTAHDFQVVGVLKSKGANGFQDQDDIVIAPLTTAQDLLVGHHGRPQPDHRRGDVVEGGRRRGGRGDLDPDAGTTPSRTAPATFQRPQPGLAAPDDERDHATPSPCCSPRSRRSRCSSAGSA